MPRVTLTCAQADAMLGDIRAIRQHAMPERASYRTRKLRNQLQAALKEYSQSVQRLVQEHAKRTADGKPDIRRVDGGGVQFEVTDQEAYSQAMRELNAETIEVDHIEITEGLFGAALEQIPAALLDRICDAFEPAPAEIQDDPDA